MMMASGKKREDALPLVEKTMKKVEQDSMIKKGLIQNLNQQRKL